MNSQLDINADSLLKKFKKDSLVYAPAILIPAFLNVLTVTIVTRLFSAESFGQYSIVIASTGIFVALISQWINQSIQRYRPIYKKNNKQTEFNLHINYMIFGLIIGCGLISISFAPFMNTLMGDYEVYYWPSVILIILQSIYSIISTIYRADLKAKYYRLFQVLNAILKLLIALVWILLIKKEIIGLVWGGIISFACLIVPMYVASGLFHIEKSPIGKNLKLFWGFSMKFMVYGFPMLGWFLGTSLLNLGDRYMLEYFSTSEQVGIYSANYSLVMTALGLISTPLLTSAHPVIMNAADNLDREKLKEVISRFSRVFLIVIVPLTVYIIVFRTEITNILLGEEFREGKQIIPVLIIGMVVWKFSMFGHKGLEVEEKTRIMLWFVVIATVFNLLLNALLIPDYGYVGAANATLISFLIYPILIYFYSRKNTPWVIKGDSAIRIILCSIITGLLLSIINSFLREFIPSFILIIIGCISFIIIYLLLLLTTNELNIQEKRALNRMFGMTK
ncbi:lipopolysaccharide biosynthesis protein [Bacillus taeanensis]|uniref:Uncharacterized protein n=1 Tax=Bacillus taeanensis TaxID=273032 RepID=A0A366XSM5_9BACI|nr:polysaccharide biosynthesis C-terminal domain-containing protein [Bacillus taeanensis]RBW68887.1 hypothetical protein DS031_14210 [Bacillus taeanensis]